MNYSFASVVEPRADDTELAKRSNSAGCVNNPGYYLEGKMQIKKIKRMRNTLAELRPGLAFTMGDDRICMKVRMGTMPEEMVVRFPDHHFVVDLESGAFRELEKTTLVEPVTCTVSVERRWA